MATLDAETLADFQTRLEAGDLLAAAEEIEDWLARAPHCAEAWSAQAHLLRLLGHVDEAIAAAAHAVSLAPHLTAALLESARMARLTGHADEAADWYERAAECSDAPIEWYLEWLEVLDGLQRDAAALKVAGKWSDAEPESAHAWFALGLRQQLAGDRPAAMAAYSRAMELDAELPMLRNNLGALHFELDSYASALRVSRDALNADPKNHLTWTNVANAQLRLRQPKLALIAAERACTLAPDFQLAMHVHCNALKELGRHGEALRIAERAATAPNADAGSQWALAMLQLLHGDYRNGLINHEARWGGSPELKNSVMVPQVRWSGEDLAGKTLFLWGEQGYGDVFQFVRFLPQLAEWVRQAGGKLVYCCFAPLYEMFKRCFDSCDVHIVPHDAAVFPQLDYQIPLGSLPLLFGITPDTLSSTEPYLMSDPARKSAWQRKMAGARGLKVGLAWSGNRQHQRNPMRSILPAQLADALATVPNVEYYSLQIDGKDDVREMNARAMNVNDLTHDLHSYEETAALIGNLDLVITVCTSVAHLSGALGARTWLLLDSNPHWVWMLDRSDSPWYPSMTLYRQRHFNEWSPVLQKIATDLASMASV